MEKPFAQMSAAQFQSLKRKASDKKPEPEFSGKSLGIKYKDDYVDVITLERKKEDIVHIIKSQNKTNAEIKLLIKKTLAQECELRRIRQGNPVISWENFQKTKLFNRKYEI